MWQKAEREGSQVLFALLSMGPTYMEGKYKTLWEKRRKQDVPLYQHDVPQWKTA